MPSSFISNDFPGDECIRPWQDTLLGQRDIISEDNEAAWRRETLAQICGILLDRAKAGLSALATRTDDVDGALWLSWTLENIRTLWEEEASVAAAVAESVQKEVQF